MVVNSVVNVVIQTQETFNLQEFNVNEFRVITNDKSNMENSDSSLSHCDVEFKTQQRQRQGRKQGKLKTIGLKR